ncbi:kinase [Glaciecola sp. XM2]|uniref:kinase n=1 Tax=Glaciecola sp. XM2 TaxID=1914931 RepID=UPI00331FE300
MSITQLLNDFIEQESLPNAYIKEAEERFIPLAKSIIAHHDGANKPIIVGINGAQGSGKSTLCALLAKLIPQISDLCVVSMSLDDFYLTKNERLLLSQNVHPLLATRGVPGTHDTELLASVLSDLVNHIPCTIPVFDKAIDDRAEPVFHQTVDGNTDIIILEGWCVGVTAQSDEDLKKPVNALEAHQDARCIWRSFVNAELAGPYQSIFANIDYMIMLRSPSFDCIYKWRCEQEHKMLSKLGSQDGLGMSDAQILRFIQHYQRITEHGLNTLGDSCNVVYQLDENRNIVS